MSRDTIVFHVKYAHSTRLFYTRMHKRKYLRFWNLLHPMYIMIGGDISQNDGKKQGWANSMFLCGDTSGQIRALQIL